MVPIVEELPWRAPHELFHAFAGDPFALFLDSAGAAPGRDAGRHGRWSYIALDPFDTISLRATPETDAFGMLREKLAALPETKAAPHLPPFLGGAAGFFGYGLARTLERLPNEEPPFANDDQHLPDMALGFYDTVLAFDMTGERLLLVTTGLPEADTESRMARAMARAAELRMRIDNVPTHQGPRSATARPLNANFTRAGYEKAVQRVIDYIHAGDIFQANLSQRFETRLGAEDTSWDLYCRLRNESPAPFACYFNFREGEIVSSSPERFLRVENGRVETQPIKGTRPRGKTPDEDKRLADELLVSEKDRAENVMIVDLLRNDISRVCRDHSVIVDKLCALESFSNVHHLVSTVYGELREDAGAVDLLAACFPGGSITGAPKVHAMEIIAELEPTTRGPYCGAIGWLGADGAMDTSIAIRTMVAKEDRITFQAGGGIVADSNPHEEYLETLAKARAMAHALGVDIDELMKEEASA